MPARGFPDLRDYRGVVDCRAAKSGLGEERVAEVAQTAQVDFVCLNDRVPGGSPNYGIGGFTGDVLFIPGAAFEVAGGGEILGLDLHDPIAASQDAPALIEAIHRQQGVAVVNLPGRFRSPTDYALADGFEVYNLAQQWAAAGPASIMMRAIFFGTDRFLAALDTMPVDTMRAYDAMASGAPVALVAGIGAEPRIKVLGSEVGTYAQLFEFYTTHLLATERGAEPLMDALKRGHAYVSFDVLGYVPSFAFYAEAGGARTMMGEAATLASSPILKVELPAAADEIVMFASGAQAMSAENTSTMEFSPKAAGAYRVEARRGGHVWILSNPIYVR